MRTVAFGGSRRKRPALAAPGVRDYLLDMNVSSPLAITLPRQRLSFSQWPTAVYAIGDVHGCLDQLLALEEMIRQDAASLPGEKWLITLGDYGDRGPATKGVIQHLLDGPDIGLPRFSLFGNHEKLLLDFLRNPPAKVDWLRWGGLHTLASYGVEVDFSDAEHRQMMRYAHDFERMLPPDHRAWLEGLPICLSLPGTLFVHAGIRPNMTLDQQSDEDLVWIRSPFLEAALPHGLRVVHGHTPGPEPVVTPHRIDVDTMCFASGILTAVCLTPDGGYRFLQTRR